MPNVLFLNPIVNWKMRRPPKISRWNWAEQPRDVQDDGIHHFAVPV
jgi:hypothetical protein